MCAKICFRLFTIPDEMRRTRSRQDDALLYYLKELAVSWLILFFAGLFEITWAVGLKYTVGFTRFWPSVWTFAAMILSVYLLSRATASLPIGTAYAIWVGIGAAGAVIFGIILFNEPLSVGRMFFLSLLLVAIMGLKWTA